MREQEGLDYNNNYQIHATHVGVSRLKNKIIKLTIGCKSIKNMF